MILFAEALDITSKIRHVSFRRASVGRTCTESHVDCTFEAKDCVLYSQITPVCKLIKINLRL